MRKKLLFFLACSLFFSGGGMFLYPKVQELIREKRALQKIDEFEEKISSAPKKGTEEAIEQDLLAKLRSYNQALYEDGQREIADVFSAQTPLLSKEKEEELLGYLSIEAMDVKLPLYAAANEENLRKGAVLVERTSLPIGGENTNTVIAAHRGGYHGEAMFRDIETLKPGDDVRLVNRWETLTYSVVKSIVIRPDDQQAIKIVEGEELLTLVTCHPYGANTYRYVVYCRRKGNSVSEKKEIPYAGIAYESSQEAIRQEELLDALAWKSIAALMGLLFVFKIGKQLVKKKDASRKRRP